MKRYQLLEKNILLKAVEDKIKIKISDKKNVDESI